MFSFMTVFCESDAKASSAPRPRKSSSRKKASSDSVNEIVASDTEANPTVGNSERFDSHEGQEVTSAMSQSPSEQNWNSEVQSEIQPVGEYYSEQQAPMGYADEEGYYEDGEGYQGQSDQFASSQNQNQILLTLSYSLMNQVRQVARMEGVFPEDILIELIAEGVTRRAFEDAQRPAPSHLMTRTGYVAPDANGNVQQPHLSHHGMQGNQRGNHQGHNNRRFHQNNNNGNNRGNHFQGRNRQNQFKNKQRSGK